MTVNPFISEKLQNLCQNLLNIPRIGSKEIQRSFFISLILLILLNLISNILMFSNVELVISYDLTKEQLGLIRTVIFVVSSVFSIFSFPLILIYISTVYYLVLSAFGYENIKYKEVFRQVTVSYIFVSVMVAINIFIYLIDPHPAIVSVENSISSAIPIVTYSFPRTNAIYQIIEFIAIMVYLWINIVIINSFSRNYQLPKTRSIFVLLIAQSVTIIPELLSFSGILSSCPTC